MVDELTIEPVHHDQLPIESMTAHYLYQPVPRGEFDDTKIVMDRTSPGSGISRVKGGDRKWD